MIYFKTCAICGKEFQTEERLLEVCSPECKMKRQSMATVASRRKRREKEKEEEARIDKVCLCCGNVFHSSRVNKIYCSPRCCEKMNQAQHKERREALKEAKAKKKTAKSIAELTREARERGMDYGNYIAIIEMGKSV